MRDESLVSAVDDYMVWAAASGYAATTTVSRREHLVQWTAWCDARGVAALGEVTPALLERYRVSLATAAGRRSFPLALTTQALRIAAVRMFCAWAARTRRVASNPATEFDPPRLPRRLPRAVLSARETERVLAEPDTATLAGLRDRAILEVLYSTGIRRMEVVRLDVGDLDSARGVLFIREGKGGRDRVVPIGARAIAWTVRYLDRARSELVQRGHGDVCVGAPLFVNARGARFRPTKLTERLHAYVVRAHVNATESVHIFRHTMATLMHEGGADIRVLQEILGHADLKTTAIYTHVSIARLKTVHTRTHPAEMGPRSWPDFDSVLGADADTGGPESGVPRSPIP